MLSQSSRSSSRSDLSAFATLSCAFAELAPAPIAFLQKARVSPPGTSSSTSPSPLRPSTPCRSHADTPPPSSPRHTYTRPFHLPSPATPRNNRLAPSTLLTPASPRVPTLAMSVQIHSPTPASPSHHPHDLPRPPSRSERLLRETLRKDRALSLSPRSRVRRTESYQGRVPSDNMFDCACNDDDEQDNSGVSLLFVGSQQQHQRHPSAPRAVLHRSSKSVADVPSLRRGRERQRDGRGERDLSALPSPSSSSGSLQQQQQQQAPHRAVLRSQLENVLRGAGAQARERHTSDNSERDRDWVWSSPEVRLLLSCSRVLLPFLASFALLLHLPVSCCDFHISSRHLVVVRHDIHICDDLDLLSCYLVELYLVATSFINTLTPASSFTVVFNVIPHILAPATTYSLPVPSILRRTASISLQLGISVDVSYTQYPWSCASSHRTPIALSAANTYTFSTTEACNAVDAPSYTTNVRRAIRRGEVAFNEWLRVVCQC
ncbi:hypothetical protein BV25DRAFT_1194464 [Artomyces pyxidatus]|uniref:Uncharacterized protein n=1 Tax=Artomyces pyxidatus TaxID=48021 RepID=A0ACB8SRB8_9AGAM|nr:hypothetical protein BV25DRAFT_1194464 [Artomyces pyxidatus]